MKKSLRKIEKELQALIMSAALGTDQSTSFTGYNGTKIQV
jgi:hypothetical protein